MIPTHARYLEGLEMDSKEFCGAGENL